MAKNTDNLVRKQVELLQTDEELEYNPYAAILARALEGQTPDGEKMDKDNIAGLNLLHYRNTFSDDAGREVVEEYSARYEVQEVPGRFRMTKVQINYITGEVTVWKSVTDKEQPQGHRDRHSYRLKSERDLRAVIRYALT